MAIPHSVLVVDDEADIRQILLCVLAPVCEVLAAADGTEALRLIRSRRPGLLLLDVAIPGMSGLDLLAAARWLDPSLLVVMLTGEHDLAVAKRALDAGARAYITKPFEQRALRDEIARLLEDIAPVPDRPWRVLT
ncbi:MAG: response regulator [Elusimicrobia bacterium]|nr:response regulator [Elusimicrobiota bacterium]